MKNKLLFLLFVFTSTFVPAQNAAIKNSTIVPPDLKFQSTTVINNLDTVVFDLAQQTNTTSTVMFPVYFLSDDTVNALDFSFKFDMSKFSYDTIFNHTNYLTAVFYQAADSVLRLTSYSLQNQPPDGRLHRTRKRFWLLYS